MNKPMPNEIINLPPQDVKPEPGQPTFKQALQKVVANPKKKKSKSK